jgi:hypothetical protein
MRSGSVDGGAAGRTGTVCDGVGSTSWRLSLAECSMPGSIGPSAAARERLKKIAASGTHKIRVK